MTVHYTLNLAITNLCHHNLVGKNVLQDIEDNISFVFLEIGRFWLQSYNFGIEARM